MSNESSTREILERAVRAFTTPRRIAAEAEETSMLSEAMSGTVIHGDAEIATWTWDAGPEAPRALMVHGWDSRGSHMLAFARRLHAYGWTVVMYDGQAHGDSGGTWSTVVEQGRVILSVAAALGPFDSVIAHSAGSPSALFAMREGMSVSSSVHLAGPASLRQTYSRFCGFIRFPDELVDAFVQAIEEKCKVPMDSMEPGALVERLTHRALIVHDPEDKEVPFSESEALARAWSSVAVVRANGLGHRRLLRDPDIVDQVVHFVLGCPASKA